MDPSFLPMLENSIAQLLQGQNEAVTVSSAAARAREKVRGHVQYR